TEPNIRYITKTTFTDQLQLLHKYFLICYFYYFVMFKR
ncbi:unnamed protein product, partial [Leptidea sinapis]